jgi:hypothetical protein
MRQFSTRGRRVGVLVHVATAVGWMGAVVAALGISIIGVASSDAATVRGASLILQLIAWYVLLPLGVASLGSGVVQSLGTPWGLIRYYWVLAKLAINVLSVVVLLAYTATMAEAVTRARDASLPLQDVRNGSAVLHGAAAVVVLLVATWLSLYKPRGSTPWRTRGRTDADGSPSRSTAQSLGSFAVSPPTLSP